MTFWTLIVLLITGGDDLTALQSLFPNEPGDPMVVTGTVYAPDRQTPIAGAVLDFYHTDQNGLYRRPGSDDPEHRLNATVTTDAQGQFAFQTIRPAHYPDGGPPAHIHFQITAPSGQSKAVTLFFDDDPRISAAMRQAADFGTPFGRVVPAKKDEQGVWHVIKHFTIQP